MQYILVIFGILGVIVLPLSIGKLEFIINFYASVLYVIAAIACSVFYNENWDFPKKLVFLRVNIFVISTFVMVSYICHNLKLDTFAKPTDFLDIEKLKELKFQHWAVLVPLLLISTYYFSKLVEELELYISSKFIR